MEGLWVGIGLSDEAVDSLGCLFVWTRSRDRRGVRARKSYKREVDMIRAAIAFATSNYVLDFLVMGLIVSAVAITRAPRPVSGALAVEKVLAWYVFCNIGLMFFVNFVFHVFFGQMAAAFIGWADSPFQVEVGVASLGFSIAGFIAAFASFDRRLVAVIGPSIFSLGAGVGHIRQMITEHNFAPGNAGVIFYLDFIIPIFGLTLLWLQHRYAKIARKFTP
jgi:hypothetical protein